VSDGPDLRVSDQERERAAEEIREHFAAGRLDEDELNERVSAVYAAKTNGELAALRADLPALPLSRREERAELATRRAALRRRLIQQSGGGIALLALCTAIWLIDGANGQFWPVWVLIVVLLPLIRNGWALYGPAPELDSRRAPARTARAPRPPAPTQAPPRAPLGLPQMASGPTEPFSQRLAAIRGQLKLLADYL
jgi:hypothetical protein